MLDCCQGIKLIYVYFENMGFGENLKQELAYSGLIKKELAAKSGVHKRAIDTYVRTKSSMPPADTAVKIAQALGVTVEYLVTGEDSSIPNNEVNKLARAILNLKKRDQRLITLLVKAMSEKYE
jgi:transcriptional regulator with XRE-family HTH domain